MGLRSAERPVISGEPGSNGRTRTGGSIGEPIAIVGMACRFPGADDLSAFWRLLTDGRNAVKEGEPGSGVGRIGKLFPDPNVQAEACRFGAYLDEVDLFDASFFRISPLEAQYLDPQQRLMLETSWQALEDAAIDPASLEGSRTGVYGGISTNDYRSMIIEATDSGEPAASLYTVSGTSYNTAIGRVSYALGLGGPAIAIDTACSSSLVAIHQAVAGLQQRETDLALAGGVHTILSGRLLELRGNAGMLSPDGQCKTFDASANGYVRGEGCGIIVLKRLSDAERDNDRIWALIRGSALNQDGASQGLTVPSAEAQQRVIEDALARAGVEPQDIDYVETHGTGTPVGDPIEMEALGAAYGKQRDPETPLLIGSVKTNFGHLESAAGVAGVMKTVLATKHRTIPKHLNFSVPNPEIDWENLPISVTDERQDWPESDRKPVLAGVSGFGWSGTNAHVIVEGYEQEDSYRNGELELHPNQGIARKIHTLGIGAKRPTSVDDGALNERTERVLPLSAKTPESLRGLANRYVSWLDDAAAKGQTLSDSDLADAAWTAGVGRSHFEYRAGTTFSDIDTLREELVKVGETDYFNPIDNDPKIAFVYTGQGSQWLGMGESIYLREPVVRNVLDRCEEVMREVRGVSMLDIMFNRPEAQGDLHDTAWTQPTVYALQCALTALWQSLCVKPDVVIGHSLGEFAAAYAAGVFGLEDGLRFVARRGKLLSSVPELGAMAAIFATPDEVSGAVEDQNRRSGSARLCIAVDNGVHQVVSGPVSDVDAISQRFEAEEVRVRRLRNQAFHSPLVEPVLDELESEYGKVDFAPSKLALISNLTGSVLGENEMLDGNYWRRHARNSVQFKKGIDTMADLGAQLVVEVGPNAVLGPLVSMSWPERKSDGSIAKEPNVLSTLLRNYDELPLDEYDDGFVKAAAKAYESGINIDFEGLFSGESRRRVSIPSYAFQRERYWIAEPKRRRPSSDHPLLGAKQESARGEVIYENEIFPNDPAWLDDHRVYGRVVMPGAVFGAMAASVLQSENAGDAEVQDLQLHSAMVFAEDDPDDDSAEDGRRIQLVLDKPDDESPRQFGIYSKSESEDDWTLHAEGNLPVNGDTLSVAEPPDFAALMARLESRDLAEFYEQKADSGIGFGPTFKSVAALWSGNGEAIGEVAIDAELLDADLASHPVLIDGCFQVFSAARNPDQFADGVTYLPFAWERMWFNKPLPRSVICYARMNESAPEIEDADGPNDAPEALTGDIRVYTPDGELIGGIDGYAVKRATRESLILVSDDIDDLLYEVVWRDRPLETGTISADFLPTPASIAAGTQPFTGYMADDGIDAASRAALLDDLERLSWTSALKTLQSLGWGGVKGETVDPKELRQQFGILPEHERLFRRLFELLARAGFVEARGDGFLVVGDPDGALPELMPEDVEEFADEMLSKYPHGETEIGLFRRCAGALIDTLRGDADPLTLLFGSGSPSAADLYLKSPAAVAANRMLSEAVDAMMSDLPDDRRLRILEIGAGTGSATASVLPVLPDGRYDYVYTDISAGFFAEAESRFGGEESAIEYRVLDIEKSPVAQGYEAHSYDILIASNVLHATRYLNETLANCIEILAPSGLLVALENLRSQGWMDLTFGPLDGWWRFADEIRPHAALSSPDIWTKALGAADFDGFEILGVTDTDEKADRGVIVAQGLAEVVETLGVWVLFGDSDGVAQELVSELEDRNQTVILVKHSASETGSSACEVSGLIDTELEYDDRESWRDLFEGIPSGPPVKGIVHLAGIDGGGPDADPASFAYDTERIGGSALAMIQGIANADVTPTNGVWFLTRGAQVLERERGGEIAGAILWGFGKVVGQEAPHLMPRMIDIDPAQGVPMPDLVDELLHPDAENHIAYRHGLRHVSRLERLDESSAMLSLPGDSAWVLKPDEEGGAGDLRVEDLSRRPLELGEVRLAVEAVGVNFRDVMVAMGMMDDDVLGGEVVGRVVEKAPDVTNVSVGERVVGLCFRSFASEVVTRGELLAPAPDGYSSAELATIPLTFTTVELSFEIAKLKAGDKVLIHSGAGGVGLSAIQMAQAVGAEVFATASSGKHDYLRSIGVEHIFDSRQTTFGAEILEATNGKGVDVLLNSLVGEDYLNANLACLAEGGRWIELAAVGIFTEEEMAEARPDVKYEVLQLDALKSDDPARPGAALRRVMEQISAGDLRPIAHSRWPMSDAVSAVNYMRSARHIGKLVLTNSPMLTGNLRADRTYLVTGGLGGIGIALADWLADHGAGAIVLNGRRDPDPEALEAIDALRRSGVTVDVAIADVTDAAAVEGMLDEIDSSALPLGGVIHSVGVLSDAALTNQSWESFETVLWPKVLGSWHLHRATMHRDLDLFVLFSSVAGVLGNSGQANHASANAFLDQLAGHRRASGLPGQTIAWGAWSELGEAEEQRERIAEQLEAVGTGWMSPQQGLAAFELLVRQDVTNGMAAVVDWDTFADSHEGSHQLLERLLLESASDDSKSGEEKEDLMTRLRSASKTDYEDIFAEFLQDELRAVMRMQTAPSLTVGFFDLGIDSLMSVEFRNRLNRALAGEYVTSNTIVFDYPNVSEMARHLAEELGEVGEEKQVFSLPTVAVSESVDDADREDTDIDGIAVVGMACRFPGAGSLEEYWDLLASGTYAITDGRRDNGSWEGVVGDPFAGEDTSKAGAYLDGIDMFDSRFFRISPIEAKSMDPQQRMLLETTWQALEDAGIEPHSLRGSRTGVYAGVGRSEYRDLIDSADRATSYLGTNASIAAGRVAFALGLEGPAMPVDMACASSLASVHQAVVGLQRGEVDVGIAGGVNVVLSPEVSRFMMDVGMLSTTGRSSPFDASADGYVRGEGCGMVILKRLEDAEADGDRIWAVIRGSGVNQNGASAGLTVPNGSAQERIMHTVLDESGVSPAEVDYLEAHAVGSQLGDPIELNAAASVYGAGRNSDRPLLVGSVKSNIGHTEWAAGIAAFIKTVLAINRGVIPKHLNFENPNPHVEWDQLPLTIADEQTTWPATNGRAPIAGVNAFSMSGANAHVLISGYSNGLDDARSNGLADAPVGATQDVDVSLPESLNGALSEMDGVKGREWRLLPLSGTTDKALRDLASGYLDWLDDGIEDSDTQSIRMLLREWHSYSAMTWTRWSMPHAHSTKANQWHVRCWNGATHRSIRKRAKGCCRC